MPQGLSVRVRLLLIGPGAGMRVARASLPRFGALRRDNTPTPACLSIYIWGVHRAVQSAPRAVSEVSAMGVWHLASYMACQWPAMLMAVCIGVLMRECVVWMDGWIASYFLVCVRESPPPHGCMDVCPFI